MSTYFEELITKNKLGISDYKEFEKASRYFTSGRTRELEQNPIKGSFDYQHLKDIHKHIFQDVFEWAGKDRNELEVFGFFGKGKSSFCAGENIPDESKKLFNSLKEQNYFKESKSLEHFAKGITSFISDLNVLHPFREGNGRSQRVFVHELAKNAGYKLDLGVIQKDKLIAAFIDGMSGHNGKLEALIKSNLKSFKQNQELINNRGLFL